MSGLIRVTLRYSGASAEIIRAVPIDGPPIDSSIEVDEQSTGGWIEVADSADNVVHRQSLPDPHAGTETFTRRKKLRRVRDEEPKIAAVELPWPGEGASLVVHSRPPVRSAAATRTRTRGEPAPASSVIARLVPEPRALPVTRSAPVAVMRPIWGHTNSRALTLVFMSEGFTAAEVPTFHQVVSRCVQAFEQTPPFDRLLAHLAVAEIELPSRVSGVSGTTAGDTPFLAHFQSGSLGRVIRIDQERASAVLDRAVPRSAVGLVVVNTKTYGGSGGPVTVFSCEPNWAADIAMHELGHSRFGLADEYDAAGQAATMKPVEPNVCGSAERRRLKWAHLVAAGTPLPTQRFGQNPPAGKPLGAYEGAKYTKLGVYRPAHDCKMRTPGQPFCEVCREVMQDRLARHAP
jgi:hypothetical protein